MIVRLISLQVPRFWDVIKYALQQTEVLAIGTEANKFNEIFASLLSDKAQCFLKYGEDGGIQGVMVTEIHEDKYSKEKSVKIRSLYAYKVLPKGEWREDFELVKKLAISEKCTRVFFDSRNPRVLQVGREVGFKEVHTTMEIPIGG